MGGVRSKHLAQVLLAEDQHSVGDLGSDLSCIATV